MARSWATFTTGLLVICTSCASRVEPLGVIPETMDVPTACAELLGSEPSIIPRSEAEGIAGSLDHIGLRMGLNSDPRTDAIVYLEPPEAGQLDAVAAAIVALPGMEIVTTVDQDATYEEFAEVFEGTNLVESVTPDILPPRVEVRFQGETGVVDLERALADDDRIYDTIDEDARRELLVDDLNLVEVQFGDDLVALRDSGPLPFREAVSRLLDAVGGPPDDARDAIREMTRLIEDRCR